MLPAAALLGLLPPTAEETSCLSNSRFNILLDAADEAPALITGMYISAVPRTRRSTMVISLQRLRILARRRTRRLQYCQRRSSGVLWKSRFGQVVRCIDHKIGVLVAIKMISNKKVSISKALLRGFGHVYEAIHLMELALCAWVGVK